MGCYDSIIFECKNCGRKIEAQSKSGECLLRHYTPDAVPFDVALDANRHAPYYCKCGKKYEFGNVPNAPENAVALTVLEV